MSFCAWSSDVATVPAFVFCTWTLAFKAKRAELDALAAKYEDEIYKINQPVALNRVLNAQSIVVVGASADPRSFGGFVLRNLEQFGFAGAIHLVSRGSTEINGRACVATIEALPLGLDLAVLAIPEAGVLDAVRQLREAGIDPRRALADNDAYSAFKAIAAQCLIFGC